MAGRQDRLWCRTKREYRPPTTRVRLSSGQRSSPRSRARLGGPHKPVVSRPGRGGKNIFLRQLKTAQPLRPNHCLIEHPPSTRGGGRWSSHRNEAIPGTRSCLDRWLTRELQLYRIKRHRVTIPPHETFPEELLNCDRPKAPSFANGVYRGSNNRRRSKPPGKVTLEPVDQQDKRVLVTLALVGGEPGGPRELLWAVGSNEGSDRPNASRFGIFRRPFSELFVSVRSESSFEFH